MKINIERKSRAAFVLRSKRALVIMYLEEDVNLANKVLADKIYSLSQHGIFATVTSRSSYIVPDNARIIEFHFRKPILICNNSLCISITKIKYFIW